MQAFQKQSSADTARTAEVARAVAERGVPQWGVPGWGLRCEVPIKRGEVVLEVTGRWLSADDLEGVSDRRLITTFDEAARASRRAAGLSLEYVDLTDVGSAARLLAECPEAPNLEVLYWPEVRSHDACTHACMRPTSRCSTGPR